MSPHLKDQIIAALRRGPDVAFEAEKNFLHGKLAEKLERACSKRPPSGEMVIVPIKPTKAMLEVGLKEWSAARSNGVEEVHTIYRAMIYTVLSAAEAEGRKS